MRPSSGLTFGGRYQLVSRIAIVKYIASDQASRMITTLYPTVKVSTTGAPEASSMKDSRSAG